MAAPKDTPAADTEHLAETPAPERPMPTNVIEALARVMQDLPGIGRTEKSEQGYSYRGIEQITAAAQHLLGKYCVVFVPRVVSRTVKDFLLNSKPWTEDCLEMVYRVYGPGGVTDYIDVGPIYGLGRDNSDKGSNKSASQAFKYALLQTLCIGDSKDDPDAGPAHEADAPRQEPQHTPGEVVRAELAQAIRALTPAERDEVRAFVDHHDPPIPRVAQRMSDEQVDVVQEMLDALMQARPAREAAAAADQPEAPSTPPAPAEAPSGDQGTPTGDPDGPPADTSPPAELPSPWPGITAEQVAEVVDTVKALSKPALTDALELRGLPINGTEDTRRQRLAKELLAEVNNANHEAAAHAAAVAAHEAGAPPAG